MGSLFFSLKKEEKEPRFAADLPIIYDFSKGVWFMKLDWVQLCPYKNAQNDSIIWKNIQDGVSFILLCDAVYEQTVNTVCLPAIGIATLQEKKWGGPQYHPMLPLKKLRFNRLCFQLHQFDSKSEEYSEIQKEIMTKFISL